MDAAVREAVEGCVGAAITTAKPLSGGCVAEVWGVELTNGERAVVKAGGGTLAVEAMMLRELAERSSLPVPAVLGVRDEPELLVLSFVEAGGSLDPQSQRHAAALLGALHAVVPRTGEGAEGLGDGFGFAEDTVIGSLEQPNAWASRWVDFWREQRLLHMADAAIEEGALPVGLHRRLLVLAERLDEDTCPPPSGEGGAVGRLLHGDVWGGNVLVAPGGGRIAAFIDPAVHFGHPETELAFSTLFGTLGEPFFDRYREVCDAVADWDGFWRVRRDLYNLVPLLVHVRLFGGGYVGQLEATLERTGLV